MKKAADLRNYYDEYLDVCSSVSPLNGILELRKQLLKDSSAQGLRLPFGTCLMDYSCREYSYISDHCDEIMSYTKDEYEKGGFEFHVQNFHPGDRTVFVERVFRDIRNYWKHIPASEIDKYRFSFNHRYYRRDGSVSQLLQKSTYMEPNGTGEPVLNLLTFTDIGDFKTDASLVLTISRLVHGQGYVTVFSKKYPQEEMDIILTKRELEILRLCLEGLTCVRIAERLFISVQTVKNHKRNMMAKTFTQNITGLINLCIRNNWL